MGITKVNDTQRKKKLVKSSKVSLLSVVWFIPLLAIITGIWLIYDYYQSIGQPITLHIASAENLKVDNTMIKVLDVDVGVIKKIKLAPNGKGVLLTAYINRDYPQLLASDSQYWVVKPMLTKGGIFGLSTLLSGPYIGALPGKSSRKSNAFEVLDQPPAMLFESQGTALRLVGKNNRTLLAPGSSVMYHGVKVGMVTYSYFNVQDKQPHYQIFINAPNDQLLGDNLRFWISFGVALDTRGGEIKVKGLNFDDLVGSIAFSEPEGEGKGSPIEKNHQFEVYASELEVPKPVPKDAYYLVGFFDQSIRGIAQGTLVDYKGIPVGRVIKVPYYSLTDHTNILVRKFIPILFYIDRKALPPPNQLNQRDVSFKHEVAEALKHGLVATIASGNYITGTKYISLYERGESDQAVYPMRTYTHYRVIPTTVTGLESIMDKIDHLLATINGKTLSRLNANLDELHATLRSIKHITHSVEKEGVVHDLSRDIKELNDSLKAISPHSPMYQDISRLIQQLNDLSRSLNSKTNRIPLLNTLPDPQPKQGQL